MARRSVRSQTKDISDREGNKASMTLGIVSPTMTQKATMPPNALYSVRTCPVNLDCLYAQEPLRQRNGNQSRPAKAVLHGSLKGVGPTELRVYDYQADGPVYDDCEANEEESASDEACVADGVGLADDASASAMCQQLLILHRV
jgi:hypothetical protein